MMQNLYRKEYGVYYLALDGGEYSLLTHLIDLNLPNVYINCHRPCERPEWINSEVALREGGKARKLKTRRLRYDLQMNTTDFLEAIDDFKGLGADVFQSEKHIPNSLRIDDSDLYFSERGISILLNCGIQSRFYLPHHLETAVYWHAKLQHIEKILSNSAILDQIIRHKP